MTTNTINKWKLLKIFKKSLNDWKEWQANSSTPEAYDDIVNANQRMYDDLKREINLEEELKFKEYSDSINLKSNKAK